MLALASALGVLALVVADPASGDVTVAVDAGQLVIRGAGPDLNMVDVLPYGLQYVIVNGTSKVASGTGCTAGSTSVAVCGGMVMSVSVTGGDASDVIGLDGVAVPVSAVGGAGDDAIVGGSSANSLSGGDGVDLLEGGSRDDRLQGGEADDLLIGAGGADTEVGGAGDDILRGGDGDDVLRGGTGIDLLLGGAGSDELEGGGGPDVLSGGTSKDSVVPGPGADRVLGTGDAVTCQPGDQAVGQERAGCAPLHGRRSVPSVWPPKRASAAPAISLGSAWPRPKGNANRVTVLIRASRARRVRSCIRTYDVYGRLLDRFPARVTTRYFTDVKTPRPTRRAWTAVARSERSCRRRHG